jgi:hypothetical protein
MRTPREIKTLTTGVEANTLILLHGVRLGQPEWNIRLVPERKGGTNYANRSEGIGAAAQEVA